MRTVLRTTSVAASAPGQTTRPLVPFCLTERRESGPPAFHTPAGCRCRSPKTTPLAHCQQLDNDLDTSENWTNKQLDYWQLCVKYSKRADDPLRGLPAELVRQCICGLSSTSTLFFCSPHREISILFFFGCRRTQKNQKYMHKKRRSRQT
jgi:hypothetical protein